MAGGSRWKPWSDMSLHMRKRPPGDAAIRASAPVFAALGDDIRLRIVGRLSTDGPASIARLTEGTGVTRQAVTKHLHVLSDAGLVRGQYVGRESVWELHRQQLNQARQTLDAIAGQWDRALGQLKAFVESR
jgi:DNA-binding transcriptional ArsR family regulator